LISGSEEGELPLPSERIEKILEKCMPILNEQEFEILKKRLID
jgi:hypothetical protein